MTESESPIACDLGRLDDGERRRERELLACERLCCPFLGFRLEVGREEGARLTVAGSEAALDLVLEELGGAAPGR